jgi:adenine specific DNA methylase Mod
LYQNQTASQDCTADVVVAKDSLSKAIALSEKGGIYDVYRNALLMSDEYFEISSTKVTLKAGETQSAPFEVTIHREKLLKDPVRTENENGNVVSSIDFERLKAELGSFSDIYEGRRERYGMEWPGKRDCMKLIQAPSCATLKPCPEESVDWDTTKNLFIEGDNLEVLKLLQKSYTGKVKLIYIDPPYNTGNDSFKYNDNFNHSTWLTFMKNRLEVAKDFLSDYGVIFVQCDDNEQAYLKVLMDEIFHKENFLNSIAIRSSTPSGLKTAHRDKTIIKTKDYILVYSKYLKKINIKPQYIKKERWDTHYNSFFDKDNMVSKKLIDIMIQKKLLPENSKLTDLNINDKNHREFYIKYADCIYRTAPEMPKEQKNISLNNKNKIISYYDGEGNVQYALNGNRFSFLSQTLKPVLVGCSIENLFTFKAKKYFVK